MKLLVFSDSHGKTGAMLETIKKHKDEIYAVIHLGDCLGDADAVSKAFPLIPVCTVSGNCDGIFFSSLCDAEKLVEFAGVKLFVCHGHTLGVKAGRETLAHKAAAKGAKIALYGHTHVAGRESVAGVLVLNPGSITCPRSTLPPSYAIVEVQYGEVISADIFFCD